MPLRIAKQGALLTYFDGEKWQTQPGLSLRVLNQPVSVQPGLTLGHLFDLVDQDDALVDFLSNSIMLQVIEDTIPPTIESISIAEGATVAAGVVPVVVDFSEAIDVSGINSTNFTLTEPLLGTIAPLSVPISPDQTSLRFTYLLPFGGEYQFTIDATSVTDRAQNSLGAADVVTIRLDSTLNLRPTRVALLPATSTATKRSICWFPDLRLRCCSRWAMELLHHKYSSRLILDLPLL